MPDLQNEVLFKIINLKKHFKTATNDVIAVDDISFDIKVGETLGLVGESGCGKSTLGRTILKLYNPTSGEVLYKDKNVHKLNRKESFEYNKSVQMIFQDPYSSLNPRMTIKNIIGEGLEIHHLYSGEKKDERIIELLELVGLSKEHMNRFPHEFSGGQRQRISIARALAVEPEFIVCDEPISALDVSIQAQIVNLLIELQKKLRLTYLFIAHDLSMVKYISNRVIVMYMGSIMEMADSNKIYESPYHPYTKLLISSIPVTDPSKKNEKSKVSSKSELEIESKILEVCPFKTRCDAVLDDCEKEKPGLIEVAENHFVSCFLYNNSIKK